MVASGCGPASAGKACGMRGSRHSKIRWDGEHEKVLETGIGISTCQAQNNAQARAVVQFGEGSAALAGSRLSRDSGGAYASAV
jgi:hypothetical protein